MASETGAPLGPGSPGHLGTHSLTAAAPPFGDGIPRSRPELGFEGTEFTCKVIQGSRNGCEVRIGKEANQASYEAAGVAWSSGDTKNQSQNQGTRELRHLSTNPVLHGTGHRHFRQTPAPTDTC